MKNLPVTIIAVLLLRGPLVYADTIFTDNTFNLGDYSISTFQTGGASIVISQTLTGGNPGSALEIFTTLPSPVAESFAGTSYVMNNNFVYDPSTQGTISSFGVSVDQSIAFTGAALSTGAFTPVILQGGDYFVFHIALSFTPGVYETVSDTMLTANDFDLVTTMSDETVDATVHPDFSGGPLELGFSSGTGTSGLSQTITKDALYDNLSFDLVTATPEPAAGFLMLAGLAGLALIGNARRRT
jgi:hypothetical protein